MMFGHGKNPNKLGNDLIFKVTVNFSSISSSSRTLIYHHYYICLHLYQGKRHRASTEFLTVISSTWTTRVAVMKAGPALTAGLPVTSAEHLDGTHIKDDNG